MLERRYDIPAEVMSEVMELPASYETLAEVIDLMVIMARKNPAAPEEYAGPDQSIQTQVGSQVLLLQGANIEDSARNHFNITEMPKLSTLAGEFDDVERKGSAFSNKSLTIAMQRSIDEGRILLRANVIDFDRENPTVMRPGVINSNIPAEYLVTDNSRIRIGEIMDALEAISNEYQDPAVKDFAEKIIENAKSRGLNLIEADEAQRVLTREITRLRKEIEQKTASLLQFQQGLGNVDERYERRIRAKQEAIDRLCAERNGLKRSIEHRTESAQEHYAAFLESRREVEIQKDANSALKVQLADAQAVLGEETQRADDAETKASSLYAELAKKGLSKRVLVIAGAVLGVIVGVAGDRIISCGGDDTVPDDDVEETTPAPVEEGDDDDDDTAIDPDSGEKTPEPEPITPPTVSPLELTFQNGIRGRLLNGTGELPDGEISSIFVLQSMEDYIDGHMPAIMLGNPRGFKKGDYLPRWMAHYRPAKNDIIKIQMRGGGEFVYNWRANDLDDYPDDSNKYLTPWRNEEIWVVHNGVMQFAVVSGPDGGVPSAFYDEMKTFQAYPEGQVEIYTNVQWKEEEGYTDLYDSDAVQKFTVDQFLKVAKRVPAN